MAGVLSPGPQRFPGTSPCFRGLGGNLGGVAGAAAKAASSPSRACDPTEVRGSAGPSDHTCLPSGYPQTGQPRAKNSERPSLLGCSLLSGCDELLSFKQPLLLGKSRVWTPAPHRPQSCSCCCRNVIWVRHRSAWEQQGSGNTTQGRLGQKQALLRGGNKSHLGSRWPGQLAGLWIKGTSRGMGWFLGQIAGRGWNAAPPPEDALMPGLPTL